MTTKAINSIATAIVKRVPFVTAWSDDPRIETGELMTRKQVHAMVADKLTRLMQDLERLCDDIGPLCENKRAPEIRQILLRRYKQIQVKNGVKNL